MFRGQRGGISATTWWLMVLYMVRVNIYIYIHIYIYKSIYLAPEIKGFPFLSYLLGAQVVWGRCNFTKYTVYTYIEPIISLYYTPPKLTCPLERCHFKRKVVITTFFRGRLSFWQGRLIYLGKLLGSPSLNVSGILRGIPFLNHVLRWIICPTYCWWKKSCTSW